MKFLWNSIKSEGKLYRCYYWYVSGPTLPTGTITICAKDYGNMSREICEAFVVENNSDSQTDYFETSHIRVRPDHPLYAQIKAAKEALDAHHARRLAKRKLAA